VSVKHKHGEPISIIFRNSFSHSSETVNVTRENKMRNGG